MKEKIINGVAGTIKKRFGKGYSVQFYELVKGMETVVPVVLICEPGATTGTAVHIDRLLAGLECEETFLQDVVQHVVKVYEELRNISSCADIITKPDKKDILSRVTYQLVNREKNAIKLTGLPHREILDLSAVYKIVVKDNGIETSSIFVDKAMCGSLGISGDELEDAASLNMELRGFPCKRLNSVFPGGLDGMDNGSDCLWVVTNWSHCDGAVAILYPDCLRRLARKLGGDVNMVFPSRHEVVVTPVEGGIAPKELRNIADKINSIRYSPEETITQNVYRYNRKKRKLEIAGD
jgi:hypothetical protein